MHQFEPGTYTHIKYSISKEWHKHLTHYIPKLLKINLFE